MFLKISSPSKVIYEGEIKQVNVPTETGEIVILPNHIPLVTVLKPGIIKISTEKQPEGDFIFSKNIISISVSKGIVFVDGKNIRIVTAVATTSPKESSDELLSMRKDLEEQIKLLKNKGSIEDIEKSLILMEKIDADIKLEKIKNLV